MKSFQTKFEFLWAK